MQIVLKLEFDILKFMVDVLKFMFSKLNLNPALL